MRKNKAKKLIFVIRKLPGRYKTQQMCNKAILGNGRRL